MPRERARSQKAGSQNAGSGRSEPDALDPAQPTAEGAGGAGASDVEGLPFEAAVEQLEGLVDRLEHGDLPLEQALRAFERGVALSRHCARQLDAAERRIEVLAREAERWTARPFEPETAGEVVEEPD